MRFLVLLYFLSIIKTSLLFSQEKIIIFSKGKHSNQIESIKFSQDGKYLGVATNFWIELRDAVTFRQIKTFETHPILIKSMSFSPDSRTFAVGYADGSVKIWDIDSGRELKTLKKHSQVVTSLVFSPNKTWLASGDWDGNIYLWDVRRGKRIKKFTKHLTLIRSLDFSPRGNLLVSGCADNSVIVWNVRTGKIADILSYHTSAVSCVKFNKQGDKIYSSSWDKTIRVWDVRRKTSFLFARLDEFINSITLSPLEDKLACGLTNGTIVVFDVEKQRITNTILAHDKNLVEVSFSPYNKLVSAGDSDKIIIHKLEQRLTLVPEVGSDIWLDIDVGDIGELFDILKFYDSDTVLLATEKKGLLKSLDGKTNWHRIGQNIKDIVTTLVMAKDTKVIYAGTKSNSVFISEDLGTNWKKDNEGLLEVSPGVYPEIFDIEIQPKTRRKFIATGKGIYKKKKKWDQVSDKIIFRFCFSPKKYKKLYAGSKKGGLFLSNDSGKSWKLLIKEREEEYPVRDIVVDPETELVFVARGDEGILVSSDDKNFREKSFGLPRGKKTVYSLKIDPQNRDNIFVATDKGIFTSKNRGEGWMDYSDGMDIKNFLPRVILVSNSGRIMTGGFGGFYEVGKVKEKKVLSHINFVTGSARIMPRAFPALDEITYSVKFRDKSQVIVYGHTDNVGGEDYNIRLSLNRALSTKKHLIRKGISGKRIRTFGFGMTKPLVSNATEVGRARNRRVEILIAE